MNYLKAIAVSALVALAIIFMIQNIAELSHPLALRLNLYFMRLQSTPFATYMIILLAFFVGLLSASLMGLLERFRMRGRIRTLEKQLATRTGELNDLRNLPVTEEALPAAKPAYKPAAAKPAQTPAPAAQPAPAAPKPAGKSGPLGGFFSSKSSKPAEAPKPAEMPLETNPAPAAKEALKKPEELKPADKPGDKPNGKPDDKPLDKPGDKPVDKDQANPLDKPEDGKK